MLILSEETVLNRGVLDTRSLPKRFFGRAMVLPRGAGPGLWLRLIAEVQFLRYMIALAPFMAVPLVRQDLALTISQAPLIMLIVIGLVEMRLLRLSQAARARQVAPDEAGRRLDTLAFRARACLRGIIARHGIAQGEVRLVIEQSELARLPPLTFVSVQTDQPQPRLLPLTPEDRAALRQGLFDADLTEADLLAVNHRDSLYLRDIGQEARAVSAHGRLAAALAQRAARA
ncbi:MAG: hypothetical protein MUC82_13525 [Cypionkella sp.]|jgi:hypothetical protein|nr:hypothetical protein [Cypionkella sp.]